LLLSLTANPIINWNGIAIAYIFHELEEYENSRKDHLTSLHQQLSQSKIRHLTLEKVGKKHA